MILTWLPAISAICRIIGRPDWIPTSGNNLLGYYVFACVLPYIVMYAAFARMGFLKPVLQSVTKWGDFSYGVYLYGFPVEQMIYRTIGEKIPFWAFISLSCLGALVMAILSWHLVEKQFLRMKKKQVEKINPEKHESHEIKFKRMAI